MLGANLIKAQEQSRQQACQKPIGHGTPVSDLLAPERDARGPTNPRAQATGPRLQWQAMRLLNRNLFALGLCFGNVLDPRIQQGAESLEKLDARRVKMTASLFGWTYATQTLT